MKGYCKPGALLIIICCAVFFTGAVENHVVAGESYVIQGYRVPFEMQVPPGWVVDLGTGGDLVLAVFKPKCEEDPQPPYPFISTTMEYGRLKNQRNADEVLDEHLMTHPDTVVISREWRSLEKTDVLMARLSWSSPLGRIEALKAIVDVDEHVLIISCVSLASEFETHESLFLESLNSLRQKRPPELEEPVKEETEEDDEDDHWVD